MQLFVTVSEAQTLIANQAKTWGTETIYLEDAYHRTLAEVVHADRDYPPFNRAAMDGIAIRSEDFLDHKINSFKIVEELLAGETPQYCITKGECFRIMTGAAVPPSANAVVKIEDCKVTHSSVIVNEGSKIKPWLNIAMQGEDAKEHQVVIQSGTIINATVLATLASLGKKEVSVFKKPTISVIATGNEIVKINDKVLPHQIRNSNTYALIGLIQFLGLKITQNHLANDDKAELKKTLQEAMACDVIIMTGGVSMGTADFVPQVLVENGITPIFHKVKIKPGKPIWFGCNENTVVFALPGNPMSVQTTFKIFVEPYLQQVNQFPKDFLYLPMAVGKKQKILIDEYFACTLIGNPSSIQPLKNNGSGDIISNIKSHGVALHASDSGDLQPGQHVKYIAW